MRTPLYLLAGSLFAVSLVASAEPPGTTQPEPDLSYAEKVLKDGNVTADGPGLIAFFKARTLTQAEQDRLTAAIRDLGDDSFEVREKASAVIVAAGRLALKYLKPALASRDPEVVGRARRCKEEIERVQESALVTAAAQMIGARRPEGATEVLLTCLPWIDDEALQEAIFGALAQTGLKDGAATPALTAAATDKDPARRAAAAFVLGRGSAETRRAATPLLTDADPRVRFHAAAALLCTSPPAAVPPLLALLTDAPTYIAWQTEDLLCRLAGEKAPAVSVGTGADPERKKARNAWEAWWKENADKIDLAKVNLDEGFQSGVVIAELEGRVWEAGPDHTARWSFNNASRPIDARLLPGGRVLVAEHGGNRVTERDRKGNVLWEHRVTSQPVVCQRLPNGNTFIATYGELTEVRPDKTVLYSHKTRNGMIYHAEKLRDGRFIYVTSGNTVIELDADGKEARTISTNAAGNTSGWSSVERLSNGNYLIALYSNSKVVEMDPAGKVVWQCMAPNPGHATRLRNGNTLVANIEGRTVVEYGRDGKEVWSVKAPGRPFHAWRR
jgi:HEAT repeat protein